MKGKRVAVNALTKRPIISRATMRQPSNRPPVVAMRIRIACLLLTLPKAEFLGLVHTMPAVRAAVAAQIERNRANRARLQVEA